MQVETSYFFRERPRLDLDALVPDWALHVRLLHTFALHSLTNITITIERLVKLDTFTNIVVVQFSQLHNMT